MDTRQIVRILEVIDTREYVEEGDRFVPVAGSGETSECDRCGREHEVHAHVELEGGDVAVVGTGCMGADSMKKEARRMTARAATVRRNQAELEHLRRQLERYTAAAATAEQLEAPAVVEGEKQCGVGIHGHTVRTWTCGDATVWASDPRDDRTEDAVESWRRNRLRDLLGDDRRTGYHLRDLIRRLEKRLAG